MDNIYKSAFIERESRIPAWHKKGTIFSEGRYIEPSEGCIEIGADFTTETIPHTITVDGVELETGTIDIVRRANKGEPPQFFGTASDSYRVVQNLTIAQAFDAASAYYPLETMGLLGKGERFFFTLKAPTATVKAGDMEDQLDTYFFVTDSKTPDTAAYVGSGATRIVCQNTLDIALESARFLLPINHDDAAEDYIKHMGDVLAKLAAAREGMTGAFQNLADRTIDIETAIRVFSAAFPAPKEPKTIRAFKALGEGDIERGLIDASAMTRERLDLAQSNHDYNTARMLDLQNTAMISLDNMVSSGYGLNGWTVYNAVSETEQHRANFRGDVAGDLLFGGRANTLKRAVKELFKV